MDIKRIFEEKDIPCKSCPYKLGYIKTLRNPCIECRLNGYKNYEMFLKMPFMGARENEKIERSEALCTM